MSLCYLYTCLVFLVPFHRLSYLVRFSLGISIFFFFFGVYTPNQPKAMRRPRSLPLKGSVHPRENELHKCPAFLTKEMSKEIPLFRRHTPCWSIPNKSMPPPPRPLRPSPYIYEFFRHHAPSGPPLTKSNNQTNFITGNHRRSILAKNVSTKSTV